MDTKEFLFSIIVPVYNTEKYIEKSLNSILKAMDIDCEVIIINDGSTDNSEEIIKKFLENLPSEYKDNFVYIKKDNNGLADTKNVGIDKSKGKYISVVDSDDYIGEDFYNIARKYIEENDIVIYDVYVVFEKNDKSNYVSRARCDSKENVLVGLLNGAISGSSCNKIIKRELYDNYRFPVGKEYEDTAVTPFIISNAEKIKYLPYALYYYMQREKSIVATNTYMSAFYKICNNITDVLDKNKEYMDKYKYVINEFVTDRLLDILRQDYNENRSDFINNIQSFAEYNIDVLKYVIETNMLNNIENHYSQKERELTFKILNLLVNAEYRRIRNLFFMEKVINKVKNIWR